MSLFLLVGLLGISFLQISNGWLIGHTRTVTVRQDSRLLASRFSKEFDARNSKSRGPPPPIINNLIKHPTVRVIAPKEDTEAGEEEMLGIMSIEEANEAAEGFGLDLVLINDKADPPVCKIIDYGKYKYIQEKKKKENAKKQVKQDIKEVKMSYKIDQHDFDVRLRAAKRFIGDGDRVSNSKCVIG